MIRLLAPRYWGGHIAMVLAVCVAVGLGVWQLDAWKSRREAARQDLTTQTARPLASVIGPDTAFPGTEVGRPVQLSGRWLSGATVYISGHKHDGRGGYWVVTPLVVAGTDSAMPVVRGWSPTPSSPAPTGTPSLNAWLQPGVAEGLTDSNPDDDVLPELNTATLVQRVKVDLYSAYVIAERPDTGLVAVPPSQAPSVGQTTALRNFLYAIEWWVFALFAFVIWLRWCRDTLHPQPEESIAPTPIGSGV